MYFRNPRHQWRVTVQAFKIGSTTLLLKIVRSEYTVQQNVGCCDRLHTVLVKAINQIDKAARLCSITGLLSHPSQLASPHLTLMMQSISNKKTVNDITNSHSNYSLPSVSCSSAIAYHSIWQRTTPATPGNSALLLLLCHVQYQKPSWHVTHHKMASAKKHKLSPGYFCRPIYAVAKVLHSKCSWLSHDVTDRGYPLAFSTPTFCSLHTYCAEGWQAQGQQDLFLSGRRTIPSTESVYCDRLDTQSADQVQRLSIADTNPPL